MSKIADFNKFKSKYLSKKIIEVKKETLEIIEDCIYLDCEAILEEGINIENIKTIKENINAWIIKHYNLEDI